MGGTLEHTKCKIATILLADNFDIHLKKRDFFVLSTKNISKEISHKFLRLRNHFVNCEIYHENLVFIGHVSIRGVEIWGEENDSLNLSVKVCFEA